MATPDFSPFEDSVYTPVPHIVPLRGVAPDQPLEQLADQFLASALNFVVRDGRLKQREGYGTSIGAAGTPQSAAQTIFEWVPYDGSSRMLVHTPAQIYYLDTVGDDWELVTNTTGRSGSYTAPVFFTPMRTATSGLRLIANNGSSGEGAVWWTGVTSEAFLVLSTSHMGRCSTVWRSHYVIGDTIVATGDGSVAARVHWSALGDPTVYTGTASAGSLDLLDAGASKVMTFVPMRNTLMAYKEEGVHALVYKPAPLYFTQTLAHGALSVLSRKGVIPIRNGDLHCIFTKEGIVLWDSQTVRAIGRDRVDRTILRDLNWNQRDLIWVQWWPFTQEVLIGYPSGSATVPDSLWIYNVQYDSWWETDLDFYQAQPIYKRYNPPRLLASRQGVAKVYWFFQGNVGDGTASAAVSASFQTGLFDYGMVEHKGVFKLGVVAGPASGATTTLSITKAGTENPLVPLTFASSQSLTVAAGLGLPRIDFRLSDRWISYRFVHNTVNETVEVSRLIPYISRRTDARKRR